LAERTVQNKRRATDLCNERCANAQFENCALFASLARFSCSSSHKRLALDALSLLAFVHTCVWQAVSSPFESIKPVSAPMQVDVKVTNTGNLEFTKENVDKVLEEIRPYLISDGGNVKVEHINTDTRSVYLVLEGACGSCPSSTTTMKLGIERVLKENFSGIGEVVAVDDPAAGVKKELTMEAVEQVSERAGPISRTWRCSGCDGAECSASPLVHTASPFAHTCVWAEPRGTSAGHHRHGRRRRSRQRVLPGGR